MTLGVAARIARWSAIVIAIVAAIDPVVISMRRARPEVAIVRGSAATDSALVARVAERLDDAFTLIDAPMTSAAGTVIVGRELPGATDEIAAPAFALIPTSQPAATIERLDAPTRAALESRATIAATVHATGLRGETLDVSLRSGELVVDRVAWQVPSDDARRAVELTLVPTAIGATPLRVVTKPSGAAAAASTDLVVDVHDERWAVLFFDPRPSWMSTFVRRTIERDPRFIVTSRIVTSRGVSTEVGRPPQSLGDASALEAFDAIVVGSPDALG